MNCQSFETIVNELARDQMMDATLREQALLHSANCEECAARFRNELILTDGMRELAGLMLAETAPERIEKNVLAEFRSRRIGQGASSRGGFLPISARGGEPNRRAYWRYAAVAAALVVTALGVIAVRFRNANLVSVPVANSSNPTPTGNLENNTDLLALVEAAETDLTGNQDPTARTQRRTNRRFVRPGVSPKLRAMKNTVTVQSLQILAADVEVTTDFIPLAYANGSNVQEGGQVVRLELPRYAMARFGLTVNEERYDERVRADVLVGADGLARAIRFVQ